MALLLGLWWCFGQLMPALFLFGSFLVIHVIPQNSRNFCIFLPFPASQAVETDFRDLGWPRNIIVGMAAVEDRLFILFLGSENRGVTQFVPWQLMQGCSGSRMFKLIFRMCVWISTSLTVNLLISLDICASFWSDLMFFHVFWPSELLQMQFFPSFFHTIHTFPCACEVQQLPLGMPPLGLGEASPEVWPWATRYWAGQKPGLGL